MKVLFIKKASNAVFQSSKNEEITFPHEFIFVFIRYFTGVILSEKSCQKRGVRKKYKKGGWPYRWVVYRRGGSNLLRTMVMFTILQNNIICRFVRNTLISNASLRFDSKYIWYYKELRENKD